MIRQSEDRVEVSGPMVISGAKSLLAEGEEVIAANGLVFDLTAVTDLDSSCLAVVFGWKRAANSIGKTLSLLNPPENMLSLAAVYGVADLLPQH
ncbi:MAG: STAS domain-containing protein [Sulfuritalea sp.]|nr:STAS domain-containing protein [Sulfuritalea sp.]